MTLNEHFVSVIFESNKTVIWLKSLGKKFLFIVIRIWIGCDEIIRLYCKIVKNTTFCWIDFVSIWLLRDCSSFLNQNHTVPPDSNDSYELIIFSESKPYSLTSLVWFMNKIFLYELALFSESKPLSPTRLIWTSLTSLVWFMNKWLLWARSFQGIRSIQCNQFGPINEEMPLMSWHFFSESQPHSWSNLIWLINKWFLWAAAFQWIKTTQHNQFWANLN